MASELLNQPGQHVQFANGAQVPCRLAQPPAKLSTGGAIESDERQQLTKPSRSHSEAVQRVDVAPVDVLDFARQGANAFSIEAGNTGRSGHERTRIVTASQRS